MLNYTRGARELDVYYSAPIVDVSALQNEIQEMLKSFPEGTPIVQQKLAIQHLIVQKCQIRVFPHFPFFWELCCGRDRCIWGVDTPLIANLKYYHSDKWLIPYKEGIQWYLDNFLFKGWSPVGYDHHCLGYDNILNKGCDKLKEEALRKMQSETDPKRRMTLASFAEGVQIVTDLAERFAKEAERMLKEEQDEDALKNLQRIALAARRVPRFPASSFYEALACILFCRETCGNLEGAGVSTFGHIDRMLMPYLEADLANGKITRDEAYSLIYELLSYTDAKFGINDGSFSETSTTIVLGGCDAEGNPVFNDVTRMVLEAVMSNRTVGTKIIVRISSKHPDEFFALLGRFVGSRCNVMVMPNDDTLIAANVRYGKRIEDARLYVGGGCHEVVLQNTEVNTRADSWLNLPEILLRTLMGKPVTPEQATIPAPDFATYEDFYHAVMSNLQLAHDTICGLKTKYERLWREYDVFPTYSAFLDDCLEKACDITSGGARYNSVSLSMVGPATFLDSLYAIKTLVYDERKYSLEQYREILRSDFAGQDSLVAYLRHRIPKHGTNDAVFDTFASKVMDDISLCSGQSNGRGGKFTPAFYPHQLFIDFGLNMDATPDGRHNGDYLSRGFSPSEFVTRATVTDIIQSLRHFDMTAFPESFATELTLPCSLGDSKDDTIVPGIIKAFIAAGGTTLQINVVDTAELHAARKEPEKHQNLTVRICGYSQSFNSLSDKKKDEVISRAERRA